MAYTYQECEVTGILNETDVVRRYTFHVPDSKPFKFKAGQFVMLDLPIKSKYTNRSYSIASAPKGDNSFELVIVLKPQGLGTTFLWENVTVGMKMKVSKALGKFHLRTPVDTDICFICTGTGIAPLRSMLIDIYQQNIPHKNIYMVFGNRWEKDILYREEMEGLEKIHPELKFIPVLSRENPGWNGKQGYVHPVYEELFADHRPAYFYICGWRDMLHEARTRLSAMGYRSEQIRFESFD